MAVDDPHHLEQPGPLQEVYFPEELGGKMYLAGDGAIRNKDTGYFTITGRIDDVLNVSGHRMGTMEIESALVANRWWPKRPWSASRTTRPANRSAPSWC
jgi:acyl-CoA synthetase (AMP-forming)/AMP-acid ligase II